MFDLPHVNGKGVKSKQLHRIWMNKQYDYNIQYSTYRYLYKTKCHTIYHIVKDLV